MVDVFSQDLSLTSGLVQLPAQSRSQRSGPGNEVVFLPLILS